MIQDNFPNLKQGKMKHDHLQATVNQCTDEVLCRQRVSAFNPLFILGMYM